MIIQKGDKVGVVGSDKKGIVIRYSAYKGVYIVKFSEDCVERLVRSELELINKAED